MNIQFAIQEDTVYVLEVNPRASRTIPFISKATGVPLAKVAARVIAGRSLAAQGLTEDLVVDRFFVKASVFPFLKFPGSDILLGPEMKSTGEVMGISDNLGVAFAKAIAGAGSKLPREGTAFVSVHDRDKLGVLPYARALQEMGFKLVATRGTAEFLNGRGVPAEEIFKVNEGRPNVVDRIKSHGIDLIINTPLGEESFYDDGAIRKTATLYGVLCLTTLTATAATVEAIRALRGRPLDVISLQEIHGNPKRATPAGVPPSAQEATA
jgi:carbamoyl-phosphate synthase large subunit